MSDTFPFRQSDDFSQWVRDRLLAASSNSDIAASQNSFALQPDTLALLREVLKEQRPSRAIEFGGGVSTAIFATWQKENPGFSFCTFEHDSDWARELGSRHPEGDLIHAPLRLRREGARCFLTYKDLRRWEQQLSGVDLYLVDGPHAAGREVVLFSVLNACRPGALVIVDDLRLYNVVDMLKAVPTASAQCFSGAAIEDNSHGLYLLRCDKPVVTASPPWLGVRASARSIWRCLRDATLYGTGDQWVQTTRKTLSTLALSRRPGDEATRP
jgi:predicted O-methyltransferase YrrM